MLRIESTMVSLPRDTIIQYQTHLLTLVILTIRMSITIIRILRQVVDFYLIHKPQNPKSQNPNTRIFKRLQLHTFTTYQMCKSILQYDNLKPAKIHYFRITYVTPCKGSIKVQHDCLWYYWIAIRFRESIPLCKARNKD